MNETEDFPILFNGKKYYFEDCDELFLSFFTRSGDTDIGGGVYMGGGLFVHPDGSIIDERD